MPDIHPLAPGAATGGLRPARGLARSGVARYIAGRFPDGFRPRYAYVPRCSWPGREGRPAARARFGGHVPLCAAGRRCPASVSGTVADSVPAPRACVAGLACPWSRQTAVIAAFHPPSTFSVRFVIVPVSTAGEKVHASGEKRHPRGAWYLRDRPRTIRDRPQRPAGRHRPAGTDHPDMHRTGIRDQAAEAPKCRSYSRVRAQGPCKWRKGRERGATASARRTPRLHHAGRRRRVQCFLGVSVNWPSASCQWRDIPTRSAKYRS
jgi:hypothetical protein